MKKHPSLLAPLTLAFTVVVMATAAAPGPVAVLHSTLQPTPSVQSDAWQGQSVAVDGDLVVVGSPNADVGATNSGVAKVYDATTGALMHTLVNPAPAANDNFGLSVAISGSRVVVGVPFHDGGAASAGIVYGLNMSLCGWRERGWAGRT